MEHTVCNLMQDVLTSLGEIIGHELTPALTRRHAAKMMLFAHKCTWPIIDEEDVAKAKEVIEKGER